jgi:hypothetical protein
MVGQTGCCSRLGVAVSSLASLVGVIYRLVGMCSGAQRILSFLENIQDNELPVCKMRSYKGRYSQGG